jgi:hypothetical protein
MSQQFETPEESKVENETVSDASAEKRIDLVAEKAAEKASNREKNYDQEHGIFSK